MKKPISLYDQSDYVALKKIAIKYIEKGTFARQVDELLNARERHLVAAVDKISEEKWNSVKGNRDKIKHYLECMYASVLDQVIDEFRIKAESDWTYRPIYCGIAGIKDTEEETYFYWLTHQAKYSNEVEYREVLQCEITTKLRAGKQLTKPESDWIVYVLENSDIPHESKGAPRRNRDVINRQYDLAWFILNDSAVQPNAQIKIRLERAASRLCTSYETVKADYYSAEFKTMFSILSKLQQEN